MTVKVIVQPLPPQEQTLTFERSLTNEEMLWLQEVLFTISKELLADGERYQKPALSRTAVRWYGRDEAANLEIISMIEAFAATLPETAHEPHPEQLCYTGGLLSLKSWHHTTV